MKLALPVKSLKSALAAVIGVVEQRPTIPILQHVKLVAEGATLTIIGTDMMRQCEITVPSAIASAGRTTLPGRMLRDIAGRIKPGADVTLTLADDRSRCLVEARATRFDLPALHPDDFPDIAAGTTAGTTLDLDAGELAEALEAVRFAISTEEVRYYLCGVRIERMPDGSGIRFVATDGHRLAMAKLECVVPAVMPGVIVPRQTVAEILRMTAAGADLRLVLRPDKIEVVTADMRLISKTIDGTYPDYQRVVPQGEATTTVTVSGSDASAAIDRVATVSGQGNPIKFTIGGGSIGLVAGNAAAGSSASDLVEAGVVGPTCEIGFNPRYALDVLGALKGTEPVKIRMYGPGAPARLDRPGSRASYVLMPMRI